MHSIPFRLKPFQQAVSTFIAETILFPLVVCDLIGTYVADYTLAMQPLIFDEFGHLINPEVKAAIGAALIASDCEPYIKNQIFVNLSETGDLSYKEALRALSFEIDGLINLDDTRLIDVALFSWNLDRMTAKNAIFIRVSFVFGSMDNANLTEAWLEECEFKYLSMNGVKALDVIYTDVVFDTADVEGLITNEPELSRYYSATGRIMESRPVKNCNSLTTVISSRIPLKRTLAVSLPNVAPFAHRIRCTIL